MIFFILFLDLIFVMDFSKFCVWCELRGEEEIDELEKEGKIKDLVFK